MILLELLTSFLYGLWLSTHRLFSSLFTLIGLLSLSVFLTALAVLGHHPFEIPQEYQAAQRYKGDQGRIKIRYLGISGYQISDGTTTLLLDPVVTRYPLLNVANQPIEA